MSRARIQQGDHLGRPAYDRGRGTAIGAPVPSRHINWVGRAFYGLYGAGRPTRSRCNGGRAIPCRPLIVGGVIMRVFYRIAARAGQPVRPAGVPGRSGRPGRASRSRRARRPRRSQSRPQRLFSCPARPPAAGATTNGNLSRPQRCSASIRLIMQGSLGSVRPSRSLAGPGTAAGRQPFGVDTRLCVGGVVIRPCLLRKFAFLQLSGC
jgi:hypothetical protein